MGFPPLLNNKFIDILTNANLVRVIFAGMKNMIEIVKEGIKDWRRKFKATCRQCKCEFTCHAEDGRYQPNISPKNEGDFVRINCPNCKDECIAY